MDTIVFLLDAEDRRQQVAACDTRKYQDNIEYTLHCS